MVEPPAQLHADIEKYERKHAENPDGRVFLPLAEAYRAAGELERAERLLREGLQRFPDYLSARVVLGRTLLDAGDAGAAAAEFRHVLAVDTQNVLALLGLAKVAEREDRLEEAGRWYAELLAADPLNDRARQALARIEEHEAARATAVEPEGGPEPEEVREEPADELVSETLAELYARQGHTDRAVGMYRELIRQRGAEPLLVRRLAELDPAPGPAAAPPEEALEEQEPVMAAAVEELTGSGTPTVSEYFAALLSWRPAAESAEEGEDEAGGAEAEALRIDPGERARDGYPEPVPAWRRNR